MIQLTCFLVEPSFKVRLNVQNKIVKWNCQTANWRVQKQTLSFYNLFNNTVKCFEPNLRILDSNQLLQVAFTLVRFMQ